ncbi:hypothetical protein VKT23_011871 [Stygiomarasmius scandens]|uniref:UspA domain-containing protein n=1 Tax=Marasmiellus scandens TaxID=2682957 RepID=A0ABR1J7P2_9AGAR
MTVPLPPPPRRSALKHSNSPSAATSPSSSPFVSTHGLPLVSSSPTDSDITHGPLSSSSRPSTASTSYSPLTSTSDRSALNRTSSAASVTTGTTATMQNPYSAYASMPQTPVPGYTPKVSFDTFENPVASMFSFTLSSKSDGYKRTRNTRVFLCASSPDESGQEALDWALESFVQDGDEFVVFRGVEEDVLEKDHDLIRDQARNLMAYVQSKSVSADPDRKLSIILEYIPGKVTETLDRLIALYRPDSVIVGTRGRKAWQIGKGAMGSVSRYCLTHSPVPIIVVRPERKVNKAKEKRRADPKRGTHFD